MNRISCFLITGLVSILMACSNNPPQTASEEVKAEVIPDFLPFKEMPLNDLSEFKAAAGNWQIAGDVYANIYPNPNSGSFSLETDGFIGELQLEVYNSIGELVSKDSRYLEEVVTTCQFDWNDLPAGHYMVKVFDGSNSRIVQMVKQ